MARPSEPLITVEAVTDAALELVDESGDFSLPRVAKRIGVTQSSIYHHVKGRDEIVERMRRRIIETTPRTAVDGLSWDDALRTLVRAYRDGFARHPRLAPLLVQQTVQDDLVLGLYEDIALTLERAGFRGAEVLAAISTIDSFAIGAALDLAAPDVVWAPPGEGYPTLSRALSHAPAPAQRAEEAFEFGLDVLIEGLWARLGASR
ncbi:TetR/AcrR family transcriptional regulator C-terminal domain-containing protein [Sinomonas gamaensis]|uniref:TetR/AcrR family transcriptional regulator C-terminal domain-containing protein n=1 Tax=Sinomonas gamaensis TaxID=2565624 RepID=UPI0011092E7C|nr:TetR/AcrR family transcriptional regulator C-terminal domain-containing protein [Sinomonas gamaensis]